MGQILVRQIDDRDLDRLRVRAKAQRISVEALVRNAIRREARLTVEEKIEVVRELQAWSQRATVPGASQTLGVDLIREARDE